MRMVRLLPLLFGLFWATIGLAESATFVFQEPLNQQWKNELLSYPFTAEKGTCHKDSLRMAEPHQDTAVQLSDIVYWPDSTWVRSATLSFIVDVAPLSQNTFVVHYGPQAVAAPPSTLNTTVSQDMVSVEHDSAGVRLHLGKANFPDGATANAVPGPIAALKGTKGRWFGGSRLYGPSKLTGYTAELLEQGPVFAKWQARYSYLDGRTLQVRARIIDGRSRVQWSMSVTPHDKKAAIRQVKLPGFDEGQPLAEKLMPQDGWELVLSKDMPNIGMHVDGDMRPSHNPWHDQGATTVGKFVDVVLAKEATGAITALAPFRDWWDGGTQTHWRFTDSEQSPLIHLIADKRGRWVQPAEHSYIASWGNPRQRLKWVYLHRHDDGNVGARFNSSSGERHWLIDTEVRLKGHWVNAVLERSLNQVKSMQLSWPRDPQRPYPNLFTDAETLAALRPQLPKETDKLQERLASKSENWRKHGGMGYTATEAVGMYLMSGSREVGVEAKLAERLEKCLMKLISDGKPIGSWGSGASARALPGLFDAVIDSDLITDAQRTLFRAQLAYMNYVNNDQDSVTWSSERGYCSGNLNMTVTNACEQGMFACTLYDHPQARVWMAPMVHRLDRILSENVGHYGEWPEALTNHGHVATIPLIIFAVAARNAGSRDFLSDARMRRLILSFAHSFTPRDPRSGGSRRAGISGTVPIGRAWPGQTFGTMGFVAHATRDSDPKLSRFLQWQWLQTGQSRKFANSDLGGYEYVCTHENIPMEVPDWGLTHFPQIGTLMRHGMGTKDEYYLYLLSNYSFTHYNENGGFPAFFAKGVPISSYFSSYYGKAEALATGRVLPARGSGSMEERRKRFGYMGSRQIHHNSGLPRQDYVTGTFTYERPLANDVAKIYHGTSHEMPAWPVEQEAELPIRWHRQVLFVKGQQASQASYVVMRDTVDTDEPTMWQFWTLSEKVGTAKESQNVDAFLADKPGNATRPAKRLAGNHFTALGQFGVDLDYYVASPAKPECHTLRWGIGPYNVAHLTGYSEFMDLMHIKMSGRGAYFVALFPRRRGAANPSFSTLCDAKVIHVSGDFGNDYSFLHHSQTQCQGKDFSFSGTVASIQDRHGTVVLSLGDEGAVRYGKLGLACDQAVSLVQDQQAPDRLVLQTPHKHSGALVHITTPGKWSTDTSMGSGLHHEDGVVTVYLNPRNIDGVILQRQ